MRLLLPVLLLGIVVMTPPAFADTPVQTNSSDEQAVLAFEAAVMSSYNRGDAAAAANHYAIDALVYIPGQPTKVGRNAIAANIARFMQDANFKLGYKNDLVSVAASNDLARTRGMLEVTYTDPQTRSARTITSNYLLVLRRDPKDGWQVVEDISF